MYISASTITQMKFSDLSKILFNEFKNRKSLLLGVVHKEHWPLLGGRGVNCQNILT